VNYGWLVPLKNKDLALYFPGPKDALKPHPALGVAHAAYIHDKEEKLTLFSPREVSKEELAQIEPFIHNVEYRIQARRYLGKAVFTPATEWLLGRFHFVLQVFGIGGWAMCIYTGYYQPDDIAVGIYWVILLPLFIAMARGLAAQHGKETLAGLRRLYHSPIGMRIVVLPQLTKLAETLEDRGYEDALQQVRELGLPELILFYKRASQYPRWVSKPPNYAGVIRE